jgi:hypothetical protein
VHGRREYGRSVFRLAALLSVRGHAAIPLNSWNDLLNIGDQFSAATATAAV